VTLAELAPLIGGELIGDGSVEIRRVAPVDPPGALQAGDITLAESEQFFEKAHASNASAIVVSFEPPASAKPLIRVKKTTLALAKMLSIFHSVEKLAAGVHPTAFVGRDVTLGNGVHVGPNAVVKDGASIGDRSIVHAGAVVGERVFLGADCVIHSNATLYRDIRLGDRVIVHSGSVIGSDGFGYVLDGKTRVKIPQVGTVIVEDDVEIGANVAIDRSTLGATVIRRGTKIDNLVQIAHGVIVGRRVLFAAQVGVAGSTTIEDDVVLAGQVGVAGHLRIGKGVVATAQTGIPNSVDAGTMISGYPAIPNRDWLKASAIFRQLPALKKRVAELEERLSELEAKR
jgi:UDP-3-O-[3-hydroxymyristoyl] glucosamine N-acyltransferase